MLIGWDRGHFFLITIKRALLVIKRGHDYLMLIGWARLHENQMARNTKCRERIHHMVLWRATGFSAPNAPLWKSFSSSSVSERVALGRLRLPCTTRFLRLASSTFRENANSSSFRMFILDPESDRNLWILLCSPVKVLGSYSSPLIFLSYVFEKFSQEVVKFFRW